MGGWPLIREQFVKTLAVPNTGMAVTIDIGEEKDIHPKNKQDVGKRLAQWALAKTYGKDVVACGPLYKSMKQEGGKIVVEFDYSAGKLVSKGDVLKGFAIAGEDKKFVWATPRSGRQGGRIESQVIAGCRALRLGQRPECNLFNQAGLPLRRFYRRLATVSYQAAACARSTQAPGGNPWVLAGVSSSVPSVQSVIVLHHRIYIWLRT